MGDEPVREREGTVGGRDESIVVGRQHQTVADDAPGGAVSQQDQRWWSLSVGRRHLVSEAWQALSRDLHRRGRHRAPRAR